MQWPYQSVKLDTHADKMYLYELTRLHGYADKQADLT